MNRYYSCLAAILAVSPASLAAAPQPAEIAAPVRAAQAVGNAKVQATRLAPTPSGDARPWWEGRVYRLATAPGRVSDIALQPGETLIAVAAGDTARWVIGDTTSGSGAARRTHILVKPASAGLSTNVVITTDRRVYHLDLVSGARAMTGLSWTYPQDELLALERAQAALAAAEPVARSVAVDRLNFNYAIEGDRPPWRPVRAFDDGAQVFIEFPPGLAGTEAPPLFVLGPSGTPELVNYRRRGHYYVVDRLFGAAELRLGGKRQQVVRIARTGEGRRKTRGRTS